jgi:hypothetical protein
VAPDAGPPRDGMVSRVDSGGGPRDSGGPRDAGDPLCLGVACMAFERCERGICMPYGSCVTDSECRSGEVCLHRFCIPGDADPDGDGHPASVDCDETDVDRHPDAPERCNLIDDDCDDMIDEGDPGELCRGDPAGGLCIEGGCGCPGGTFDVDRMPENGCECAGIPAVNEGTTCGTPIELGDLSDTGSTTTVTGNVMPDEREVWYHFRGVDAPDASCDTYHVRAQFTTNPGDVFAIMIYRGTCGAAACAEGLYTDVSWSTDFLAGGVGQCPCVPAPGVPGSNICGDDTGDFYLRVTRRPGMTVTCDTYSIEITNGVYDT